MRAKGIVQGLKYLPVLHVADPGLISNTHLIPWASQKVIQSRSEPQVLPEMTQTPPSYKIEKAY